MPISKATLVTVRAVVFGAMIAAVLSATTSPLQAQQHYLRSGETLPTNGYLMSPNRMFHAQVRAYVHNRWTGNFRINKGSGPEMSFGQVWATGKPDSYSGSPMTLSMQTDANLCAYQDNKSYWCKDFIARPIGTYFAVMQDDGNLCIYKGTPEAQGAGVWCSSSNQPITWAIDGKQFKFTGQSGYGTPRAEALVPAGDTISGTPFLDDTASRWSLVGGVAKWSADIRKCMTLDADNDLSLQTCVNAGSQLGWGMAGDGTLRKAGIDGCVDIKYDSTNWRDGQEMPRKAVMTVPCPSTAKKFVLN